ncbi:MAG: glycerol-3-phosphate responsive antiterminator, partial [Eubacterium sp.]
NLELLGGFGRDQVGMKLLKNYYKVDGVMSTDSTKLGMAKRCGLLTIQRFFFVDSRAFDTSQRILESANVDAAEMLPAASVIDLMPELRHVSKIPMFAGGFIKSIDMIDRIRDAGFSGITISKKAFW